MPSSINSNGILQKSQKGLSFGDMGCRVSKEGIQKEIITVAAHLRAAIGLRAAFGNFLLHENKDLFTLTFGEKVPTLAKSRGS